MYKKDFKIDRTLLTVGLILYVLWGYVYKTSLPGAIDPEYVRITGSLIILLVLGFSFISNFIKEYFTYFIYTIIILATIQQCYLVVLNQFSSEFLIIFIVLIVTLNAYFKKPAHLIYYALFSIGSIYFSFLLFEGKPIINFYFFISAVISIDALVVPIFISRLRIQQKLEIKLEELKQSEAELQLKSNELARSNTEMEQFAYIASHDLQEPLRTISNYIGLVEKQFHDKPDESTKEYLNFINTATGRMQALIRDLLDYSRVRNDKNTTVVDCNKIVLEILADMDVAKKESHAQIKVGPLPVINCYIDLKSLFQNLVSNAIKYRRSDTQLIIDISAQDKGKEWLFAITDNGIGIEKIYQERIFIIFQKLHSQKLYPGTGIGLAHCKKIVELHGGKIWVESEPEKGSTFYFTILKNPVL
jgi:signal transduction histidine kinase